MRTNFGFRPASHAQEEAARKFFLLNKRTPSARQQIRLSKFNKEIGRLVLDNFFLKQVDGVKVWHGYKIIIFRDGEVAYDREFVAQSVNGVLTLTRPTIIEKAA